MYIDGKPGRYRYFNNEWVFEEGYFNQNGSMNLRVEDFIRILKEAKNEIRFITPNYPGERRVALLPEHIKDFENEIFVEQGFGLSMIEDFEYEKKGAKILSREEIFKTCRAIFL